jgi:hypothetical protein
MDTGCRHGAIIGSAIPLTAALGETWQYVVLAAVALALLALRHSVVVTLLVAGMAGGPSLGCSVCRSRTRTS